MAFLVPKVEVTVESYYSGEVAVIDNVPVGVAAVGQVMSTVGVSLTELFETALATAVQTLQTQPPAGDVSLFFVSDGRSDSPWSFSDEVEQLRQQLADLEKALKDLQ